jgi:hypothetical protein
MEGVWYQNGVDYHLCRSRACGAATCPLLWATECSRPHAAVPACQVEPETACAAAQYERSNPIFNYTVDDCGPVHITIGALPPSMLTGQAPHMAQPS